MIRALALVLIAILVAACEQVPDVPEIDKASIYISIATPGAFSRIMLACPAPVPVVPASPSKAATRR